MRSSWLVILYNLPYFPLSLSVPLLKTFWQFTFGFHTVNKRFKCVYIAHKSLLARITLPSSEQQSAPDDCQRQQVNPPALHGQPNEEAFHLFVEVFGNANDFVEDVLLQNDAAVWDWHVVATGAVSNVASNAVDAVRVRAVRLVRADYVVQADFNRIPQ
jgi:hypothetical protein